MPLLHQSSNSMATKSALEDLAALKAQREAKEAALKEEFDAKEQAIKSKAVSELAQKLSEARSVLRALEAEYAELTGKKTTGEPSDKKRTRTSISIEQIKSAIKAGATNYRAVAAALGCSSGQVTKKIKEEGKKAGIKSEGERKNFKLTV